MASSWKSNTVKDRDLPESVSMSGKKAGGFDRYLQCCRHAQWARQCGWKAHRYIAWTLTLSFNKEDNMFTIKSYNHVKVSSVIRTMSESKGSSKESFLPGIIRKGSGKLGLTELGDGERMLYWEMEQVGQKFGGVEARRLQGDWSSTV